MYIHKYIYIFIYNKNTTYSAFQYQHKVIVYNHQHNHNHCKRLQVNQLSFVRQSTKYYLPQGEIHCDERHIDQVSHEN